MYDILTVGSATQDVFLIHKDISLISTRSFATGRAECFSLGSKIEIDRVIFDTGGGATNAAVTFARAGFKTTIFSRIGHDPAGHEVIRTLESEKISTNHLVHDKKHSTAYSSILITPDGERTVLVFRGAANHFQWKEFPRDIKTKWLYVSNAGEHTAFIPKLFFWANSQKIKIAWNPGRYELTMPKSYIHGCAKHVSILNMNREEATLTTEKPHNNIVELLHALHDIAPRAMIVITDGPKGAYTRSLDGKIYHAPALSDKIMNSTGAGDAFGSAYVSAIIKWNNPITALQFGIYNSGSVVRHMGAKHGIFKKLPSVNSLRNIKIISI